MPRPTWETDDRPPMQASFGMPRVTKGVRALLIANALLFAFSFLAFFFGRMTDVNAWDAVFGHLVLRADDWRSFFLGLPVWQLVTYGFLHSVTDLGHILMNMLTLYFFGTMLEEIVGTRRFVITYFAAMVLGGAVFLATELARGTNGSVLGASGACFAVMAAAATLRPTARVLFIFFPLTLRTLAFIIVGYDLFDLLVGLANGAGDGVAHVVHLTGAAYGFLAVRTGLVSFDPVEFLERRRAVANVERAASDDVRMDQILEKIHREGMSSLSRGEKEFLKKMSARR